MRALGAALLMAACLLFGVTSAQAARSRDITVVTFRLAVSGQVSPDLTFWVSYGPLTGRFGLLRLHEQLPGLYTASHAFPTSGRTIFAYMAGSGVLRARFGPARGN